MKLFTLLTATLILTGCGADPSIHTTTEYVHSTYTQPESPYAIQAVVDPCGDHPGELDELLLVLNNGSVIATLSADNGGSWTRLVSLENGNYVTTDSTNCSFSISKSDTVTSIAFGSEVLEFNVKL